MTTITLYTRPGCHLCEEARALLLRAGRGLTVTIDEVNIDTDAALRARYDARVPVAAIGGHELDWPFTEAQARRLITA
jgi:glutaredoxin